ncbi:MAG: hypothetical protein E2577_07785, partial [Starkeya sp.]|nr:hypothetical protein [Starkeya sp.]
MSEPDNFILTLLREIRAEMNEGFERLDRKLVEHDLRFEGLDKKIESLKQPFQQLQPTPGLGLIDFLQ